MIVKAWKVGNKWTASVEDDGQLIVSSVNVEKRVGCAIRAALSLFQLRYGPPSFEEIELNIDDW